MIKYYKTIENRITEIPALEDGCWVSLIAPTEAELCYIEETLAIDRSFTRAALDEEEASRVESEDGQTLIVIDYPVLERAENPGKNKKKSSHEATTYYTMPMSMIVAQHHVITVSLNRNTVAEDFTSGLVKGVNTQFRTQFVLLILLRIAGRYLQYLKQIDKLSARVESELHKSSRNEELFQLLGLEKSLVYFSTSLKATEKVLERLLRKKYIRLYDEDQDLLEDVLVEVKQAIEMCDIYASILSGTMDAFASIISNNLNIVMKVLTVITIVMAVPTIVFSFYGMNIDALPLDGTPLFALLISLVFSILAAVVLTKMRFYK
ncbi:MAG: magnesium transporter CorA family protein [Oscillospiraceae bacterium]|nr:magnesium transporter CorA family protein [Oscillospiraceae bacterium]